MNKSIGIILPLLLVVELATEPGGEDVGQLMVLMADRYILPAALWILAVLTWVTVGQRIWHVRQQLRTGASPGVVS